MIYNNDDDLHFELPASSQNKKTVQTGQVARSTGLLSLCNDYSAAVSTLCLVAEFASEPFLLSKLSDSAPGSLYRWIKNESERETLLLGLTSCGK